MSQNTRQIYSTASWMTKQSFFSPKMACIRVTPFPVVSECNRIELYHLQWHPLNLIRMEDDQIEKRKDDLTLQKGEQLASEQVSLMPSEAHTTCDIFHPSSLAMLFLLLLFLGAAAAEKNKWADWLWIPPRKCSNKNFQDSKKCSNKNFQDPKKCSKQKLSGLSDTITLLMAFLRLPFSNMGGLGWVCIRCIELCELRWVVQVVQVVCCTSWVLFDVHWH